MARNSKKAAGPVGTEQGTLEDRPAPSPITVEATTTKSRGGKNTGEGRPRRTGTTTKPLAQPRPQAVATVPAAPPEAISLGSPGLPGLQTEALRGEVQEVRQMLEELTRQTGEVRSQLQAVRTEGEQAGKELRSLHQQGAGCQDKFHQETLQASQRVRQEYQATGKQLGESQRLVQEACGLLLAEFEGQLKLIRKELHETRQQLQTLPRQAEEFRRALEAVTRQVPETERHLKGVEQASAAARQEMESVVDETREAQEGLTAVRHETAETESRLASVRDQFLEAEQRLRDVRRQLEQVTDVVEETRDRIESRQTSPAPGTETSAEQRNRLGVTVERRLVVAVVESDSPAALLGLVAGDVIVLVNGTPVASGAELRDAIHGLKEGEKATLRVDRGGTPREFEATLVSAGSEEEGQNRLGLTVEPGLVVAGLEEASPADVAGLAPGDVITGLDGTLVLNGEQLRQAVAPLPERAEVRLQVRRAGEPREVSVRLDGGERRG